MISVHGVSKQYAVGAYSKRESQTLFEASFRWLHNLRNAKKKNKDENSIWVLQDISFDVEEGAVVGLIGRNGSGKSTLLKILSQITYPTKGTAELYGRLGTLLEVGTGFHSDLTGRENIYLNGAIMGMRRSEINKRFDEIVEFSGIERFIDTPIKRYSSGMQTRLGFAVAAHLETEILFVDEALAVGDAEFQSKCLNKIKTVAQGGRTVLFVSHDISAIEKLTQRCLLIESGKIISDAPTSVAMDVYRKRITGNRNIEIAHWPGRLGSGGAKIVLFEAKNDQGEAADKIKPAEPLNLKIGVEFDHPTTADIGIQIETEFEHPLFSTNLSDSQPLQKWEGYQEYTVRLSPLSLRQGKYLISIGVYTADMMRHYDTVNHYPGFEVIGAPNTGVFPSSTRRGDFFFHFEWSESQNNSRKIKTGTV